MLLRSFYEYVVSDAKLNRFVFAGVMSCKGRCKPVSQSKCDRRNRNYQTIASFNYAVSVSIQRFSA